MATPAFPEVTQEFRIVLAGREVAVNEYLDLTWAEVADFDDVTKPSCELVVAVQGRSQRIGTIHGRDEAEARMRPNALAEERGIEALLPIEERQKEGQRARTEFTQLIDEAHSSLTIAVAKGDRM